MGREQAEGGGFVEPVVLPIPGTRIKSVRQLAVAQAALVLGAGLAVLTAVLASATDSIEVRGGPLPLMILMGVGFGASVGASIHLARIKKSATSLSLYDGLLRMPDTLFDRVRRRGSNEIRLEKGVTLTVVDLGTEPSLKRHLGELVVLTVAGEEFRSGPKLYEHVEALVTMVALEDLGVTVHHSLGSA